jgi:catechol 2,3-dioxygenase
MSENGSIDPGTSIGAVRLAVADLDRVRDFYEQAIGLEQLPPGGAAGDGEAVRLGVDGRTVVELDGQPDAAPRPSRTSGLFHLAILLPSRAELARSLKRIADSGWRLTGASDHLVSEALYTHDPEGNGIEIYRDRPREDWPERDGQLQMDTLPLDLDGVLGELEGGENGSVAAGTRMGHVHLNVGDLAAAEDFYSGTLGFDVTVRGYPGALFVSAGGYHHHIGLNTWAGEGAPAPPTGARGLRDFEIVLPRADEVAELERRLQEAGADPRREGDVVRVSDPAGNGVVLTSAS